MEAVKAGRMMAAASCPMCGDKKGITVAKQRDGALLEESAP
jgi:hypothetical protein